MSRMAYVDGQYLPHHSAAVHIEYRGYQSPMKSMR